MYINYGGDVSMELVTTSEMSRKWHISRRRIATLCKEGRILGSVLKGNVWLLPEDAVKPMDARHERHKQYKGNKGEQRQYGQSDT